VKCLKEDLMHRFLTIILGAAFACALAATSAFAHAFLDHAVPGVGATVSGSPSELKPTFSQSLAPAFASVQIATEGGAPVPAGKATPDPADPATLHVRLGQPLKPGAYKVTWHVVSVDTHRTEGTYTFKVAP
jgi:methionine-rich copper-binding protein CopC